jgi:hypothetical protein
MRSYSLSLRSAALLGGVCIALSGCESALTPFVGQSKDAAARAVPPPAPPAPPPTAAFVNDSMLSPGFAGQTILPPTLPTTSDAGASDDSSATAGPHQVIAAVPLSSDASALAPLSAAANRDAGGSADARFVLLVLSPPAADAATLDRNSTAARLAASAAVRVMGDGGIGADRIEVSMATSPTGGTGELRLYRR